MSIPRTLLFGAFACALVGCTSSQRNTVWAPSVSYAEPLTPHRAVAQPAQERSVPMYAAADTAQPVEAMPSMAEPAYQRPAPRPASVAVAPPRHEPPAAETYRPAPGVSSRPGVRVEQALPVGDLKVTSMPGMDFYSTPTSFERLYTLVGTAVGSNQVVSLAHIRIRVGADILATTADVAYKPAADGRTCMSEFGYAEPSGAVDAIQVAFDGASRSLRMGERVYNLDNGNYFRITLHSQGRMEVIQRPVIDSRVMATEDVRERFILYSYGTSLRP